MLISLNLENNYLTPDVGSQIIDIFRTNKTIINLEIFQNKDFIEDLMMQIKKMRIQNI